MRMARWRAQPLVSAATAPLGGGSTNRLAKSLKGHGGADQRIPQLPSQTQPEEYLSIADLSQRIPYAAQTIRNLMSRGVFKRDLHYVKPRGRVMFKWSAVQAWIERQDRDETHR